MHEITCQDCGKLRTDEPDYNPLALLAGADPGWYSGDDGELCGPCMVALFQKANRP